MNIAIFGWYHHRNAGDDRIQQCLTRWLDGHTLAFLPAGRPPPIHLLRTCDAAIIGGGGLIMRHGGMFRHMARWIRSAGIPVALAGVSVEAMTPALRRELREFLDLCCFAWFRDRGSLEAVGEHPKAFVAPDLTWLYPYPAAPAAADGVAVCLRKQSGLPLDAWSQALAQLDQALHPWPLYFEQGGDAEVLATLIPGRPVPEEFDLEPARRAAAVVSGRFHGIVFALQLGRPALAVSTLPKTLRFLAEQGLDGWAVAEGRPEELSDRWRAFVDAWPRLSEEALRIRSRLHDEVRTRTSAARDRLLAAAGELPPPSRRWGKRVRELLDPGSFF
ncbi:MAG: polysaccharide pyruvyl transferase family protein [bacterium]|nr:polysaccharide pyruvyl transferase family protein [bacterium]